MKRGSQTKMKFFTLIHICRDEKSLINSNAQSFDAQISLYLTCARQLYFSLQAQGYELIILTNDQPFLERIAKDADGPQIIEIPFPLAVPKGILFYSAHFKIDAYRYLAGLEEDYVALVDSDVLCINTPTPAFINAVAMKTPLYYDITDQVTPAYGATTIIKDKEALGIQNSLGLWAGGEFISGSPQFFKKVVGVIEEAIPFYFQNFKDFHHQGDEVLTSVAIERLQRDGIEMIAEAGSLSIIARYWNARTKHVQKPLAGLAHHFLIHLPADKAFFGKINRTKDKPWDFFGAYTSHLSLTKFTRPINALKRMIKK
jgi:hypothetical protein